MDEFGPKNTRDDLFSKAVRAGKRTYFFDVKSTRAEELYLTITESKKRFNQQTGKFYYEKHKLFLYQEDFGKFKDALQEAFDAIAESGGKLPEKPRESTPGSSDIQFEDLDKEIQDQKNPPEDQGEKPGEEESPSEDEPGGEEKKDSSTGEDSPDEPEDEEPKP